MRAWLLVGLIPLVTACATTQASSPRTTPSALPRDKTAHDMSGHWTGTWIGVGMFNSPREDSVTFNFVQRGKRGYGRLIFEGTLAAESVPQDVRRQGLNGVRVIARIRGSRIYVRHELGGHLFTADFRVKGDQMVGDIHGVAPHVRMFLTRGSEAATRPQAVSAVRPAPTTVAVAPAPSASPASPPAPELPPAASEPPAKSEPTTRDIAAVAPAPAPQPQDTPAERPREDEYVSIPELNTVHFDFDKSDLRPDAQDVATTNAQWLKEHQDASLLIEGHCDERGTPEYNLALGERRAKAVMDDLEARGVAADRMTTITYGKERPLCTQNNEECHGLNRRAEFRVKMP